eukprot:jgi/Bigna1/88048/estExt_fgenesh1_pg.C_270144
MRAPGSSSSSSEIRIPAPSPGTATNPGAILVVPKNGLGNRLRTILAFVVLAREKGSKLLVFWEKTRPCPGDFTDYFEPIPNVTFIGSERAQMIRRKVLGGRKSSAKKRHPQTDEATNKEEEEEKVTTVFTGQMSMKKLLKKFGSKKKLNEGDLSKLYGLIKPVTSLEKEIFKFGAHHEIEKRIGLHLRRTDHVKAASSMGQFHDDDHFRQIIEKEIGDAPNDARFFLATDNGLTQKNFLEDEEYGDRIVVWKKIDQKQVETTDSTRHTTVRDAVIDVFLLALCKRVYGSGLSTFSTLAQRLAVSTKARCTKQNRPRSALAQQLNDQNEQTQCMEMNDIEDAWLVSLCARFRSLVGFLTRTCTPGLQDQDWTRVSFREDEVNVNAIQQVNNAGMDAREARLAAQNSPFIRSLKFRIFELGHSPGRGHGVHCHRVGGFSCLELGLLSKDTSLMLAADARSIDNNAPGLWKKKTRRKGKMSTMMKRKPMSGSSKMGTISFIGSIVILFNNNAGPGMLALPVVFQQAGIVPTLTLLTIFCSLSALSATMLCESVDILHRIRTRYPHLCGGLGDLQRYEFSNIVRFFYGDFWYSICQVAYYLSLQSINMASIIVCAQGMDNAIIYVFGRSHALEFYPSLGFVDSDVSGESIFGSGACVLSLGYLLLLALAMISPSHRWMWYDCGLLHLFAVVFAPLGFMGLGDSVVFNYLSFAITAGILIHFLRHFVERGTDTRSTPIFGHDTSQLLGIMVFCFSSATLVPSWYNEKVCHLRNVVDLSSHRGKNKNVMQYYLPARTLPCKLVGVLGAWAYPEVISDNVLNVMSTPGTDVFTRSCVLVFLLGTIAPGIAMRSITLRLNLSSSSSSSASGRGLGSDADTTRATLETRRRRRRRREKRRERLEAEKGQIVFSDDEDEEEERGETEEEKQQSQQEEETIAALHGPGPSSSLSPSPSTTSSSSESKSSICSIKNLARRATCGSEWATFWGVIFPWLISFLFYEAKGFANLINWTSLTINGTICFLVPALIYLKAISVEQTLMTVVDEGDGVQNFTTGGRRGRSMKSFRGSAHISPSYPFSRRNDGDDKNSTNRRHHHYHRHNDQGNVEHGTSPPLVTEARDGHVGFSSSSSSNNNCDDDDEWECHPAVFAPLLGRTISAISSTGVNVDVGKLPDDLLHDVFAGGGQDDEDDDDNDEVGVMDDEAEEEKDVEKSRGGADDGDRKTANKRHRKLRAFPCGSDSVYDNTRSRCATGIVVLVSIMMGVQIGLDAFMLYFV